MILSRGVVAFRPVFLSSSIEVMAVILQALQCPNHIAGQRFLMPLFFVIPVTYRFALRIAFLLMATLAFSGCSTVDRFVPIAIYKIDIIQGNFVSKEMVSSLQTGMTKDQVSEILGTPLLMSIFHSDRWDYIFTIRRQGVEPQSRRFSVFFEADRLVRFEGDAMPSEAEFADSIYAKRGVKSPQKLAITEQQKQESAPRPAP